MFKRKEAKVVDAEQEIKKDLFWKALIIYGFILIYIIGVLHGFGWDKPPVIALLVGVYVFLLVVTPHLVYDRVKDLYGIFSKKLKDNKKRTEQELSNAKLIYNTILFLFLSFFAYMAARAIDYFAFNKDRPMEIFLMGLFDLVALVLSIKITNSRARTEEE